MAAAMRVCIAIGELVLLVHGEPSSGSIVSDISGKETGEELDIQAPSLNRQPSYGTPFGTMVDYFVNLQKWNPQGSPSLPDSDFVSFPPSSLQDHFPEKMSDPQLPRELRGVWCGPTHPSDLACFIPYASAREHNETGFGIPSQGFQPGKMFFWDDPGTRNTLEFFTRLESQLHLMADLEFQIAKWANGVVPGLGSGFFTYARSPFSLLPYPVAVYEGLPRGHRNILFLRKVTGDLTWDPATSSDPALCFCSVFFEAPDVIRRNNFGKLAYHVYRVLDENGEKTSYFQNFTSWAKEREAEGKGGKLVKTMSEGLYPDLSCSGWCPVVVFLQVVLVVPLLVLALTCCCCCGCCLCTKWGRACSKRYLTNCEHNYKLQAEPEESSEESGADAGGR